VTASKRFEKMKKLYKKTNFYKALSMCFLAVSFFVFIVNSASASFNPTIAENCSSVDLIMTDKSNLNDHVIYCNNQGFYKRFDPLNNYIGVYSETSVFFYNCSEDGINYNLCSTLDTINYNNPSPVVEDHPFGQSPIFSVQPDEAYFYNGVDSMTYFSTLPLIGTNNPTSTVLASSMALEQIGGELVKSSTETSTNIISNYWGYILVISLLYLLIWQFAKLTTLPFKKNVNKH